MTSKFIYILRYWYYKPNNFYNNGVVRGGALGV